MSGLWALLEANVLFSVSYALFLCKRNGPQVWLDTHALMISYKTMSIIADGTRNYATLNGLLHNASITSLRELGEVHGITALDEKCILFSNGLFTNRPINIQHITLTMEGVGGRMAMEKEESPPLLPSCMIAILRVCLHFFIYV